MKSRTFLLLFIILGAISVFGGYKDTGFIKWQQPNGVEFTAKYWGDEYFYWMETREGYRVIQGVDKYYYYAILDKKGEYTPSKYKVGIDRPLTQSKFLERSKNRINELNQKSDFMKGINNQYFNSIKGSLNGQRSSSSTKKLGVILVKFENVEPEGYLKSNFDQMMFSNNVWVGNNKHPEGHTVFGSVYDYFLDQLNVEIVGKNGQPTIVNNPSSNPLYPEWMEMEKSKAEYDAMGATTFFNTVVNEARAEFGSSIIDYFDNYLFIFAGVNSQNWRASGYAKASPLWDFGIAFASERDGYNLRHIGSICHELGHALYGFADQYASSTRLSYRYSLMCYGESNGPLTKSECPAPISPGYKIELGLPHEIIQRGTNNKTINAGTLYKVEVPNSGEYFAVERYYHTGWYRYIESQFLNNKPGLTIWHFLGSDGTNFEEVEISSVYGKKFGDQISEYFDDYSTPSSRMFAGSALSDISFSNIRGSKTDLTYGTCDILDPTPKTPTNVSLNGGQGQNPTISWTGGGEPDISHYKIKKRYVWNSGGTTTQFSTTSSTQFIDYNVQIDHFGGDLTAYYSVSTVDDGGNQSNYSGEVDTDGQSQWKSVDGETEDVVEIETYELNQNYPNPFNPTTSITYQVPIKGHVVLKIYNSLGKEVSILDDGFKEKGRYKLSFDALKLPSGVYFYSLRAGSFYSTKKMLLIK